MHSAEERPHFAGLILARGGSRGIPLKNITPLDGRPLLTWSLAAMLGLDNRFDSVWVSTDHQKIADAARKHEGVSVFWRSARHATAESPSIDAVKEFLEKRPEVDVVGLVQCTSPFVQTRYLEKAYNLIAEEDYDSVFSVARTKKFRWKETPKGSSTQALNFDPSDRPRRQDWQGELVENGMFYFARRHLLEKGIFQGGKCTYVEVPADLSLEIDSPLDLVCAEAILNSKKIK